MIMVAAVCAVLKMCSTPSLYTTGGPSSGKLPVKGWACTHTDHESAAAPGAGVCMYLQQQPPGACHSAHLAACLVQSCTETWLG